jgi:hypothetical protein
VDSAPSGPGTHSGRREPRNAPCGIRADAWEL